TSVRAWVADPSVFVAVSVIPWLPSVPGIGVPLIVAVPLPLSTNRRPAGGAGVALILAVGDALVRTVKLARCPTVNLAVAALVNRGAPFTSSVTLVGAEVPPPAPSDR